MKQFISAHDVTDINALVAKALKYKDFLVHVYKTFEDKINSCKVEKIKNKYKKMRVDALKYIVANEKSRQQFYDVVKELQNKNKFFGAYNKKIKVSLNILCEVIKIRIVTVKITQTRVKKNQIFSKQFSTYKTFQLGMDRVLPDKAC